MIWTAKRSDAQNVDRCLQHYSPIIRNSISDRRHGHFSRDNMVALASMPAFRLKSFDSDPSTYSFTEQLKCPVLFFFYEKEAASVALTPS
jgi:hypothetical protein